MPVQTSGGITANFESEVHDANGNLVVRNVSLESPNLTCVKLSCLWAYFKATLTYMVIAMYDRGRVYYATHGGRHKQILERYRTGYPMPQNLWQAIHANIKVRCFVCRKYNVDPLLFSNLYKEKK